RHTRSDRDWSSDVCSSDLQSAVVVRDAILDRHGADRAGVVLREEVPPVIDIVMGDATSKYIARPGRQLAGEAIGILTVVRIEIRSEERRVGKESGARGS